MKNGWNSFLWVNFIVFGPAESDTIIHFPSKSLLDLLRSPLRSNFDFQGNFQTFLAFRFEKNYIYLHILTLGNKYMFFYISYCLIIIRTKNCIISTIWPLWPEFDLHHDSVTSNIIVRHPIMIIDNIWVQVHHLVTLTANYRFELQLLINWFDKPLRMFVWTSFNN